MTSSNPPLQAQRFSRTPESPRPLQITEPSNIPVLENQIDPVFNDTATYDIRSSSQPFFSPSKDASSYDTGDALMQDPRVQSQALRNLLLGAQIEPEHVHNDPEPVANAAITSQVSEQPTSTSLSSFAHAGTNAQSDIPHLPKPNTVAHFADEESVQNVSKVTGAVFPDHAHNDVPYSGLQGNTQVDTADNQLVPSGDNNSVDFQSILDQISQSAATVPVEATMHATTKSATNYHDSISIPVLEKLLPAGVGLPPKPPPQEKPTEFPEYVATDNFRSYLNPPNPSALSSTFPDNASALAGNSSASVYNTSQLRTDSATANGIPPLPSLRTDPLTYNQAARDVSGQSIAPSSVPLQLDEEERPWGPEVQGVYDKFLKDERSYVTEGVWDRFPPDSRLFVGNLPTEKVTKRDLFHIFHKHGRLAQISIKQAYGFAQFLETNSCKSAVAAEQGVELRGRKLHLEISKPPKPRNLGNRPTVRRRSRSPERNATRGSNDRHNNSAHSPLSEYRGEPARRRDDYRPMRSPSPRGYRGGGDEYRTRKDSPRSYSRYDERPRSPAYGGNGLRPPSPKLYDEDAALPLPRRDPRNVPDVQILVLEDVPRDFVSFVEQSFRAKQLITETLWLNPSIALAAVIKRQIIEGVQAVVKLTRNMQFSSKIPLQVFDRSQGTSNVNFNEYVELDVHIAADIVIQARQKERLASQRPVVPPLPFSVPQGYQGTQLQFPYVQTPQLQQPYGQAPMHQYQPPQPQNQQQVPQQQPYRQRQQFSQQPPVPPIYGNPQQSPRTPASAGPNLQELLANLRQPTASQAPTQQSPLTATQSQTPTDLANLLNNVAARQQNQGNSYGTSFMSPPQVQFDQFSNRPPSQNHPGQAPLPGGYGTGSQQPAANVQNIMDQLARYSR